MIKKYLKGTAPSWAYQTAMNSPMLYIEQGTGRYFNKDLSSEDRP